MCCCVTVQCRWTARLNEVKFWSVDLVALAWLHSGGRKHLILSEAHETELSLASKHRALTCYCPGRSAATVMDVRANSRPNTQAKCMFVRHLFASTLNVSKAVLSSGTSSSPPSSLTTPTAGSSMKTAAAPNWTQFDTCLCGWLTVDTQFIWDAILSSKTTLQF